MGQIDRFVERTLEPPPTALRVFSLVVPVGMVVQAVATRRLEDILTAVFFVVLILPSGIAPTAFRARAAALDARPVLGPVLMFPLLSVAAFVLLRLFLDRPESALVALPLALVLTLLGLLRRRARTQSSG